MTHRILPASQAIPTGRLDYIWTDATVVLHTVQRLDVLTSLERDGLVVPTLEHSDHHEDWPIAYAWMADQVAARTGVNHGTGAVFWAWAYTTRSALVSSVAHSARWARKDNDPQVLLTLRVPAERVVVSCFSEWHSVLMALPVMSAEESALCEAAAESDEFYNGELIDEFCRRTGKDWWNYEEATDSERQRCHDSWSHCLRPAGVRPRVRNTHWQACLPDLRAIDVHDAVILS